MLIGEKGHQQMVDDQCFPHWHDGPVSMVFGATRLEMKAIAYGKVTKNTR